MSCDYQALPHIGIRTLSPYVPGKSVEELAQEKGITDIIKLASNENPLGCSPKVKEAIINLEPLKISTYPAAANHPLKKKLCEKLNVSEACLILSNGSDLLFSLLLTIFGLHTNRSMLTHDQAFITYSIQAQLLSIPVRSAPLLANWEVDIDALVNMANEQSSLIFLANPNNPTGLLIPLEKINYLLNNVSDSTIVVIDEAYYEYAYAPNYQPLVGLLQEFPNLVITRTFSKAYGLAGLRLGYAIAHPDIIDLLYRVQLPFTVNQAALAGGYAALEDEQFLAETTALNTQGMKQMQQGLTALNLDFLPSACNFITFDCGENSLRIYQQLLEKGIIVRPLHAYHLPNHLRVSIGKLNDNTRFLNNLALCLTK